MAKIRKRNGLLTFWMPLVDGRPRVLIINMESYSLSVKARWMHKLTKS